MLKIAICDDDQCTTEIIYNIAQIWIKDSGNKCQFMTFNNPEALLSCQENFDALFLDVAMPYKNGFEVAKIFRNKSSDLPIIFISSHHEMIQEAFKVQAFRYIFKPIDKDEIIECLFDLFNEFKNKKGFFYKDRFVVYNDILYIESLGDGSVIHLTGEDVVNKKSLKFWNNFLCEQFCQCHKSYIVNFHMVKKVVGTQVTLVTSQVIPVSVRRKSFVKNAFYDYMAKNAKCI